MSALLPSSSAPAPSLALDIRAGVAAALFALACLGGCPHPGPGLDEPGTASAGDTNPAQDPGEAERACGIDTRFDDYRWVPSDARLATAVERGAPAELDAALAQLAELTEDPQHQLPIFAALDFRNLGLQLGTLDQLLAGLDFDPSEVVELQAPSGDFVWLWPTDCPRELLAARVLERHGLMMRVDLEHPRQRRASGSPETLPFDLLVFGERRMAMTLAGRGAVIGAWLDGPSVGGAGASDDPAPGERLAEIAPAPIRSVLAGEALLTTSPESTDNSPSLRQLRATATDATLETPP